MVVLTLRQNMFLGFKRSANSRGWRGKKGVLSLHEKRDRNAEDGTGEGGGDRGLAFYLEKTVTGRETETVFPP